MAALLPHGEGGAASQAAQLPPDPLPLQRLVGHAQRKLQAGRRNRRSKEATQGRPSVGGWWIEPLKLPYSLSPDRTTNDPREEKGNTYLWLQATAPLTLSSADSPRSVSFKELHGNWPVTLYRLRVRLKERTTGRTAAKTAGGLREFPRVRFFVTYLRSKDPG